MTVTTFDIMGQRGITFYGARIRSHPDDFEFVIRIKESNSGNSKKKGPEN